MKKLILLIMVCAVMSACKKDKYTTAPQITYKSISPRVTDINLGSPIPFLTFEVRDAEGDIGFKLNQDTAYIYLTNNLTGKSDSLPFPDLSVAAKSNFKADVIVSLGRVLACKSLPSNELHTDTLFFNVYVKDFAGNKSNVMTTGEPVYFTCR